MRFILASKSPRRYSILKNIGLEFDVMESDVDETSVSKDMDANIYVQELAMLKSSSVAKDVGKNFYVIGADTVVYQNGKILGKPKDFDEAFEMLSSLSGQSHKVYTGISVTDSNSGHTATDFCETEVFFNKLTESEISDYINKYKPFDKAGAYGIQEYAAVFVKKINGDFFNVVGLPVSKLYTLIKNEFDFII